LYASHAYCDPIGLRSDGAILVWDWYNYKAGFWDGTTLTYLNNLPTGVTSFTPAAMNSSDVVLCQTNLGPMIWDAGNALLLCSPGAGTCYPIDLNNAGNVIGDCNDNGT